MMFSKRCSGEDWVIRKSLTKESAPVINVAAQRAAPGSIGANRFAPYDN
jgi:hypothetical protein